MPLTIRQQYEADQAARIAGSQGSNNPAAQAAAASLSNSLRIAQAFAKLAARSAQLANAARIKAAKANIKTGTAQISAKEIDERSKIAQALAQHQGTLKVNAAFRGTLGSNSTTAGATSASFTAGRAAVNVSANAYNDIQRLISENNPQLEDVKLAALEGGLKGFGVGQNLASALAGLGTSFTTPITGGGDPGHGGAAFSGGTSIFSIPGLDLGKVFQTGKFASF